jgi:hypothetical protein
MLVRAMSWQNVFWEGIQIEANEKFKCIEFQPGCYNSTNVSDTYVQVLKDIYASIFVALLVTGKKLQIN